jgi:pectin methylesterase-like acyl-CoA thioesterase
MWRAALLVGLLGCGKHINPAWCDVPGHSDPACERFAIDAAVDAPDAAPTVACTTDDQCASAVCSGAGTCVDPATLLYATAIGGAGNTCTADAPCMLAVAIAGSTVGRNVVVLAPGVYTEGVTINRPVTLIGKQATRRAATR